MNEGSRPRDLEPREHALHRVLSGVPTLAPPMGFRDAVMRRITAERRVAWEWIVAALLALPSLAFLARQLVLHGQDFAQAVGNIVSIAATDATDATFFVDGLDVLAVALVGIACLVATHALLVTMPRRRTIAR